MKAIFFWSFPAAAFVKKQSERETLQSQVKYISIYILYLYKN
jgi:hypothetical protein